jgi:hypothetical protein
VKTLVSATLAFRIHTGCSMTWRIGSIPFLFALTAE